MQEGVRWKSQQSKSGEVYTSLKKNKENLHFPFWSLTFGLVRTLM